MFHNIFKNTSSIMICIIISAILIVLAPLILSKDSFCSWFALGESGSWVGDTIGGITAPIIGFLSIILLYKTLKEQLNFNKKQNEFNDKQDKFNKEQLEFAKSQKLLAFDEQFRTTFFNLLNIQRDIADKIRCVEKDQNVFLSCLNALHLLFLVLENKICAENFKIYKRNVTFENLKLSEYDSYIADKDKLFEVLLDTSILFTVSNDVIQDYLNKNTIDEKIAFCYKIFYYKLSRIGVYYRHLYHILKYIDQTKEQEIQLFNNGIDNGDIDKKYMNYAQLIQAQMSFEQLGLLFYNSFMFKNMQKKIIKYNLLENLYEGMLFKPEHNCIPEYNLKKEI